MTRSSAGVQPFMPDLCRLPVVLGALAVTQLLVIVYVLSLDTVLRFDWELLSLLSLYAQWLSMLSIAVLCNARRIINSLPVPAAALLSFAIVLGVAASTNATAQWIYHGRSWVGWSWLWLLRDLAIVAVFAGIALRYIYVQQQWLREQSASDSAKLDALHARIRPHFLFNSMNTIASLIHYAPEQAEAAVEDLAALMRASLSERQSLVPWARERAICEAYMRIEHQRLGERLQVNWNIDDIPEGFMLPPLVLQPLLENAIYHGIEKLPDGGSIDIDARRQGDSLRFVVRNTAAPDADNSETAEAGRNGIALQNIRARLASIYRDATDGSDRSALALIPGTQHFIAQLDIPLAADARA